MDNKASLTVAKRAEIMTLHNAGFSEHEIKSRVIGRNIAACQDFSKFKISWNFTHLKRSGFPR